MEERPTPIEPRRLQKLFERRTRLQGELAEVDMEIQRIQMGQRPHDLSPILRPISRLIQPCTHEAPCTFCGAKSPAEFARSQRKDIFWEQQTDFNQTAREQQAKQQDDAKSMTVVPYEHLLQ